MHDISSVLDWSSRIKNIIIKVMYMFYKIRNPGYLITKFSQVLVKAFGKYNTV